MKTSYAGFLLLTIDDVPTTIHKSALSARAMMSGMRCGFSPKRRPCISKRDGGVCCSVSGRKSLYAHVERPSMFCVMSALGATFSRKAGIESGAMAV